MPLYKKPLAVFILILSLCFILGFVVLRPSARVCFQDQCLGVELAVTAKERAKGLMHRVHLPENRGMLFVFPYDEPWSFWMKNTYIRLDILWMDEEGRVVDFVKALEPAGTDAPRIYRPEKPARYVLETNAGFIDKNNIKVGDRAGFKGVSLIKK
jgi:uncharacterized membrane protein (UPF0127 family)